MSKIVYIASTDKDFVLKQIDKYIDINYSKEVSPANCFKIQLCNFYELPGIEIFDLYTYMEIDFKISYKTQLHQIEELALISPDVLELVQINEFNYKLKVKFVSKNSITRLPLVKTILNTLFSKDNKIQFLDIKINHKGNDKDLTITNNIGEFLSSKFNEYIFVLDPENYDGIDIKGLAYLLLISESNKYNLKLLIENPSNQNNKDKHNDKSQAADENNSFAEDSQKEKWLIALEVEMNNIKCSNFLYLLDKLKKNNLSPLNMKIINLT